MAQFSFSPLLAFINWIWRRFVCLWRVSYAALPRLLWYPLSAIGWGTDSVNRDDTDPGLIINPEEKTPVEGLPLITVDESDHEGQHEAEFEIDKEQKMCEREEGNDEEDFDSEEYRVDHTDELFCEYDSTWESDESDEHRDTLRSRRRPTPRHQYQNKFNRFESAARDMHNYRHGYPSQVRPQRWQTPTTDEKPNLDFYLGLKPSEPDRVFIQNFHDDWFGEYDTLEYVHTYIQWLFPLEEPGLNYEASTLTKVEVKEFVKNDIAKANLLKSYKLMLDFYGIRLRDETTGAVERAPNWRERFHNLNSKTHNNLRITRILKCQGILGLQHCQAPLVHFFLKETLVHGELQNVRDSVLNYFVFAVLDKRQRRSLLKYAYTNYGLKDEFVWCPKKIQMAWSRQSEPQIGMDVEYESEQ